MCRAPHSGRSIEPHIGARFRHRPLHLASAAASNQNRGLIAMSVSLAGMIVCAGLLIVAFHMRGMLIVGLLASLAFGSTAVMTLSSLGGSSPLIYTVFAALLVAAVGTRRHIFRDLGGVFGSVGAIWVLAILMAYAAVGAWLLPRLFAGQTNVFVQSKMRSGVVEASLGPVSSNISQSGYFILGGLTAIALCVLLTQNDKIDQVRRGFFVWCTLHTAMGLIDLLGKLAGTGDLLMPIRTASYVMLTEANEAGFSRIAGAYSEASAFGAVSLACLAFCYTYWRRTKDLYALWLSLTLLMLVVLSTSSTAYVGLMLLGLVVAGSTVRALLTDRIEPAMLHMTAFFFSACLIALAVSLYRPGFFDPFFHLIDTSVINKANSSSGHERAYWNLRSLQSFNDTMGLGIGLGSSRASSWPIAVLSQLGLVGTLMIAVLVAVVVRGLGRLTQWVDPETAAVVASVRNSALAGIAAASLASGSADPGIGFFVAFAVISATRVRARLNRSAVEYQLVPTTVNGLHPWHLSPNPGHAR